MYLYTGNMCVCVCVSECIGTYRVCLFILYMCLCVSIYSIHMYLYYTHVEYIIIHTCNYIVLCSIIVLHVVLCYVLLCINTL